jgi:threonine dehydrogenase-like Zn-dependent dehydrogenase
VLNLRDIPHPSLPGGRWIKVKPVLSEVCGLDMGTIFFKTSPVLPPFNTFPAGLGHEVVGVEIGEDVRIFKTAVFVGVSTYTCIGSAAALQTIRRLT